MAATGDIAVQLCQAREGNKLSSAEIQIYPAHKS